MYRIFWPASTIFPSNSSWFTALAWRVLLVCWPVPLVTIFVKINSSSGTLFESNFCSYFSWMDFASEMACFTSLMVLQDAKRFKISSWHFLKNFGVSRLRVSIPRIFISPSCFAPKYLGRSAMELISRIHTDYFCISWISQYSWLNQQKLGKDLLPHWCSPLKFPCIMCMKEELFWSHDGIRTRPDLNPTVWRVREGF